MHTGHCCCVIGSADGTGLSGEEVAEPIYSRDVLQGSEISVAKSKAVAFFQGGMLPLHP